MRLIKLKLSGYCKLCRRIGNEGMENVKVMRGRRGGPRMSRASLRTSARASDWSPSSARDRAACDLASFTARVALICESVLSRSTCGGGALR